MKKIIVFCVLLSLIFVLSARVMADEISITYWTHVDENREPLEEELIEEFMEIHPNVNVEYDVTGSTDHIDRLIPAFAAGRGPTLLSGPPNEAIALLDNNMVVPLDAEAMGFVDQQEIFDTYVEGTLDWVTRDEVLYGVPLEVSNFTLFVNEEPFREAGLDPEEDIPVTWEEMLDVSKELVVRDNGALAKRGFDFRYSSSHVWFGSMVEQAGGQLYNEDKTETLINSEATMRVLELLREFGPQGMNLGSPAYEEAHRTHYTTREAAMCTTGSYQILRTRASAPDVYENLSIAPLPRFEGGEDVASRIYTHSFLVNADASEEEQEMAWKLIGFLTEHASDYLEVTGLIQPREGVMESEAFQELIGAEVFVEEMAKGSYAPIVPNQASISDAIESMIESAVSETTDLQELLDQTERRINDLLQN